jgi:hypothetical protein
VALPRVASAVATGERLGDKLAGEPLELGVDLPGDELGELGPVLLNRAGDGLGDPAVEHLGGHVSECTTAARRHPGRSCQRECQRTGLKPARRRSRRPAGFRVAVRFLRAHSHPLVFGFGLSAGGRWFESRRSRLYLRASNASLYHAVTRSSPACP